MNILPSPQNDISFYSKYFPIFEDSYLKILKGQFIPLQEIKGIFQQARFLMSMKGGDAKKQPAIFDSKTIKSVNNFVNHIAIAYLNDQVTLSYGPQVAQEIVSYLMRNETILKHHVLDFEEYQAALKMAERLSQFQMIAATVTDPETQKIYLSFKEAWFTDILENTFTYAQQQMFLEGIHLFIKEVHLQSDSQNTLSYLMHHDKWIAMRLHSILTKEEHLTPSKVKQALMQLCDHPRLATSHLENSLIPILSKDFERRRTELLESMPEVNQVWQKQHINSLMNYQNHSMFYSPELNQYFIKYQGQYELFNEVLKKINTEFHQGNSALYYLEDGLVHYDPEKSSEALPLFSREASNSNDLKYKIVIISAKAKEKGQSDLGHAWMRLEEPFEKNGKQFVRVYSLGLFSKRKFIIPDKYEFIPRDRLETAFEISQQQFEENLKMIKLFRASSHDKTLDKTEVTTKFDQWAQTTCVELLADNGTNLDLALLNDVLNKQENTPITSITPDKLNKTNTKSFKKSYPQNKSFLSTHRLKLTYRWLYADSNEIRKWQEQLITNQALLQSQFTKERTLSTISIL